MIAYIFKSSLSLIILFGLYWFLLRKEKLFVFNRFFLVASVVFSLGVPFISIPVNFQVTPLITDIIPTYDYIIPEISTADNIVTHDSNISHSSPIMHPSAISISAILLILYISGVILFLIRFLKNLYMIIRRSRLSEKINFKGYRIVLNNDKTGPCCFFNSIFLNREDYLNGRIDNELLEHELEHARQSHTIDIILIELVKIFYWFNPIHVLYERAIRINHEYLADNGVISDNTDIKSYAEKLLNFITWRSNMSLTSGSNHSFTKKRLLMMTKTKSKSFIYGLRITIALSLILIFSLLISFKQSNVQPSNKDADSSRLTDLQTPKVKDIDGNVYPTITIGNQVWMAENLKTTKYNDGTVIPNIKVNSTWASLTTGAYCDYENTPTNSIIYGRLYNWHVIDNNSATKVSSNGGRNVCPAGWHVPSDLEWTTLNTYLGGDSVAGGVLKEIGSTHWVDPNWGASNESGFTALPGGGRYYDGRFSRLWDEGHWWSTTEFFYPPTEKNATLAWFCTITYSDVKVSNENGLKNNGFSVRCIKDVSEKISNSPIKSGEMTQNSVRGIIMTEDGKPLYGAAITNIRNDNTSHKFITGSDGSFTINDLPTGTTLLIECPGFKGQTTKADFTSEMIIKLVRDPDYKGKIVIPVIQNVNFRNSDFTPADALLVIDDQIVDYKEELKVNPGEIKSFKILTDKEAINKYGDKAKDGVVEITLYGNKTESIGKKSSNSITSDTIKYKTLISVNHVSNKGELIDIPVSNLQYVSAWTYHDLNNIDKKELRTIGIMTRDYYKVQGKVVQGNGKPLPGVKINVSENPVSVTSDKEGRFVIEDVREGALLEFSLQGYKKYYLSTSFEVPFNIELTIKLEKDEDSMEQEMTTGPDRQNQSKDIVIAPAKMNILYRGVPNPIEIAVPGVKTDKVIATMTNGTIKRIANGWEVMPGEQAESVITISVNAKKVSEKIFRVKDIPDPVAIFSGKYNGAISRNVALKTEVLEAKLIDFDWDLKFEIVSFTLLYSNSSGNGFAEYSVGNKLTDKMKSLINSIQRGDKIIFKDIKAIGPDGGIRDLNPIALSVD